MRPIDLRSDTVTHPTPAMREAMADADVGDDVFGEDPTVNRLEAEAAARVGKEAALFVPSGTMANQIAIRIHTRHGESVLASQAAHILRYEAGGAAALSGVQITPIGEGGLFDADDVRAAILPDTNVHFAPTSLLAVENTHNASGGRVFPIEQLEAATAAASAAGLRTHLDGARLFNAVVASGIDAAQWAALVRHGLVLLLEGARRAGRLGALRLARRDRVRAPAAQDVRRRHAAGRGSSPPPRSTHSSTTSDAWPRITPTRNASPKVFSNSACRSIRGPRRTW